MKNFKPKNNLIQLGIAVLMWLLSWGMMYLIVWFINGDKQIQSWYVNNFSWAVNVFLALGCFTSFVILKIMFKKTVKLKLTHVLAYASIFPLAILLISLYPSDVSYSLVDQVWQAIQLLPGPLIGYSLGSILMKLFFK